MARILIADDDDDIRQLVVYSLEDEGHQVVVAKDGKEAIDRLVKVPTEILILDISMPEMDGFGVLKKMTETGLKDRTKVLVLTARTAEADWLRGYRLGADYYITKPFTVDELLRALRDVMTMSKDQLAERRKDELEKAKLLSKIESAFDF